MNNNLKKEKKGVEETQVSLDQLNQTLTSKKGNNKLNKQLKNGKKQETTSTKSRSFGSLDPRKLLPTSFTRTTQKNNKSKDPKEYKDREIESELGKNSMENKDLINKIFEKLLDKIKNKLKHTYMKVWQDFFIKEGKKEWINYYMDLLIKYSPENYKQFYETNINSERKNLDTNNKFLEEQKDKRKTYKYKLVDIKYILLSSVFYNKNGSSKTKCWESCHDYEIKGRKIQNLYDKEIIPNINMVKEKIGIIFSLFENDKYQNSQELLNIIIDNYKKIVKFHKEKRTRKQKRTNQGIFSSTKFFDINGMKNEVKNFIVELIKKSSESYKSFYDTKIKNKISLYDNNETNYTEENIKNFREELRSIDLLSEYNPPEKINKLPDNKKYNIEYLIHGILAQIQFLIGNIRHDSPSAHVSFNYDSYNYVIYYILDLLLNKKENELSKIQIKNQSTINNGTQTQPKNQLHNGIQNKTKKNSTFSKLTKIVSKKSSDLKNVVLEKSSDLKNVVSKRLTRKKKTPLNTSNNEKQNKTQKINQSAKLNNAIPNNNIPTMNETDLKLIKDVIKKLNSNNNNLENNELKLLLKKLLMKNLRRTQRFFKKIEKDLKTKKKKSEYFKLKQSVYDKYRKDVESLGYNKYLQSTKKSINTLYSDLENQKSFWSMGKKK